MDTEYTKAFKAGYDFGYKDAANENRYNTGVKVGINAERERIIKLLEDEAMAKSGGLIFSNFILQREFKLPDGSDVVLLNDVFEAIGRQLDWLIELIKGETQ